MGVQFYHSSCAHTEISTKLHSNNEFRYRVAPMKRRLFTAGMQQPLQFHTPHPPFAHSLMQLPATLSPPKIWSRSHRYVAMWKCGFFSIVGEGMGPTSNCTAGLMPTFPDLVWRWTLTGLQGVSRTVRSSCFSSIRGTPDYDDPGAFSILGRS